MISSIQYAGTYQASPSPLPMPRSSSSIRRDRVLAALWDMVSLRNYECWEVWTLWLGVTCGLPGL